MQMRYVPERVSVSYQVPLTYFDDVESGDFIIEADLINARNGKAAVKLVSAPGFIRNAIIRPSEVEFFQRVTSQTEQR